MTAWQLMDFSMTKMKQLAPLAEPVAENGITPNFTIGGIKKSTSIGDALKDAAENVRASRERHLKLRQDSETQKHAGMIINLDLNLKAGEIRRGRDREW
jgi:bacterioferritin